MKAGDVRICPSCQARNKPKWEYCVRCGESLEAVTIVAASASGKSKGRPSAGATDVAASGGIPWLGLAGAVLVVAAAAFAYRSLQGDETPAQVTGGASGSTAFTAPTLAPSRPPGEAYAPGPGAKDLETGRALFAKGEFQAALPHLAQAVADEPDNPLARHAYALALRRTGSEADALTQFREAVRLAPTMTLYRSDLAKALTDANQTEEAISVYEGLLADQPDSPAFMLHLARLQASTGRADQALPLLTRAAEIAPNRGDLQEATGYALEQAGRKEEAIQAYQKALQVDPKSVVGRGRLAELVFAEGRKEDAISLVRSGLQESPDSPELHRSLGSLLERSGSVTEAIAAYREYSRLAPGAADAKEMSQRAADLEKRARRPAS